MPGGGQRAPVGKPYLPAFEQRDIEQVRHQKTHQARDEKALEHEEHIPASDPANAAASRSRVFESNGLWRLLNKRWQLLK